MSHYESEHIPDIHEVGEATCESRMVGGRFRCVDCGLLFDGDKVTPVSADPYSAPICIPCSLFMYPKDVG